MGFSLQQGAQLGRTDGLVEERDLRLLDGIGGGRRGVAGQDDGRDGLAEMGPQTLDGLEAVGCAGNLVVGQDDVGGRTGGVEDGQDVGLVVGGADLAAP